MSLADEIESFRQHMFRGLSWEADAVHQITTGFQRIEEERQAVALELARFFTDAAAQSSAPLSEEPNLAGPWPEPPAVQSGRANGPNGTYGYQPPPPPPGYEQPLPDARPRFLGEESLSGLKRK